MSDEFLFADDVEEHEELHRESWKVLIVDDEPEVHMVTKLAFSDFVFQDKDIEFISAHSGEDAKRMVTEHDDIAVVLLDVVMETDDAGLQVANFIRNDAQNYFTRIILRTGQPGQAPEREVIVNYDINDYKSKTELTAQKLFTVVISALRSYRDIIKVEQSRKGLETIINSSTQLFNLGNMESFMENLRYQLESLLDNQIDVTYLTQNLDDVAKIEQFAAYRFSSNGEGGHQPLEVSLAGQTLSPKHLEVCKRALIAKTPILQDDVIVAHCASNTNTLLVISGLPSSLNKNDRDLVDIFAKNVQAAFEKIQLANKIASHREQTQTGRILECRLNNGRHVRRITLLCERLGVAMGISQDDIDVLSLAVRLHDIGTLVVPEKLLTQSGDLTKGDITEILHQINKEIELLKGAHHPVIKTAAMLAREQHELWDGTGQPNRLVGDQIHLFSRIVALADYYNVLSSSRPDGAVVTQQQIVDGLEAAKGKQLDPDLVDCLIANFDDFELIMLQNPDSLS